MTIYLMLLVDHGNFPFKWDAGATERYQWSSGMYRGGPHLTIEVEIDGEADPRAILDRWLDYNVGTTTPRHPPLILGLWLLGDEIPVDGVAVHAAYVQRRRDLDLAESEGKERALLATLKSKYEKGT